jgi:hypothetical protein
MYRKEPMEISALAGKPVPRNVLVDPAPLEREYYERRPDVGDPNQLVSFGTSGHRGSSLRGTFTEAPSHNSPEDGGCKYNPPHGGPAETAPRGEQAEGQP